MKNILKKTYYRFTKKDQLKSYNIKLSYIFHTEKIYDDDLFDQLMRFCKSYFEFTNVKPICAIIPPTNALLKKEMMVNNFSEEEFINRVNKLSNFADIGYHGHFYLNNKPTYFNAIHCNSYKKSDLTEQFINDINWFDKNKISHNNIYSAGWWFMNQDLIALLVKHGFQFDFSFSKSPYFYNQFSNKILNLNKIKFGENFEVQIAKNKKITCIQNLIGFHSSKFPEDFDRNIMKLIDSKNNIIGVVNSHDYDLSYENTLNCIKYQIKFNKVKFCSYQDLLSENNIKLIKLITSD